MWETDKTNIKTLLSYLLKLALQVAYSLSLILFNNALLFPKEN